MRLQRTSLFRKYILIYSCMVLCACLLLGFALSHVYLRNLNEHTRTSTQLQAELAMADLQDQLDTMYQLSLELTVQKSFHPISYRVDKIAEKEMLDALKQYRSYRGPASEFILIYWFENEKPDVFRSFGQKSDLDVYLEHNEVPYTPETEDFLRNQSGRGRVYVADSCILVAYPVTTDAFPDSEAGTLCFIVPKASLLKRFKLSGNLAAEDCSLSYNGQRITTAQPGAYTLTVSDSNGFSLEVSCVHVSLLSLITSFDTVSIFLIVAAILFVGIISLAYMCYRPIRKLVEKYGSGEKPQSNELVVLDGIIRHLQVDSEALGKRTSSQTALMRNYLLLMLLNNVSTHHMAEDLAMAGIHFPNDLFAVMTIRPVQHISPADMELIARNIYEFSEEKALLYVTESNPEKQILSIICNFEAGRLDTAERKITGYLQYQPFRFAIGRGQSADTLAGISASYLTAQMQMEKGVASEPLDAPADLKTVLERIRKDLYRGDTAATMLDVSYYLDVCGDESSELLRRYHFFNLKRAIQQASEELHYRLSDEQLSALLVANDRQSASRALSGLIEPLCASVREQNEHTTLSVSQMVIDYLKKHFCDYDISAQKAAEALGIGINRTNAIIREQTGDTCKVYITCLRMDYAAQLLMDSDASIAEISEKTGYASVSHFIKRFKATYDETPDSFRKSNLRKESGHDTGTSFDRIGLQFKAL